MNLKVKEPRLFFSTATELLQYLLETTDSPLIILSDVNLQRTNGIDLKKKINEDEFLRKKTIPFLFLSTSTDPASVDLAYDLGVQGFFQKPASIQKLELMITHIIGYWKESRHPNFIEPAGLGS